MVVHLQHTPVREMEGEGGGDGTERERERKREGIHKEAIIEVVMRLYLLHIRQWWALGGLGASPGGESERGIIQNCLIQ